MGLASELNLFAPVYPGCKIKLLDAIIKITSMYKKYKIPKSEFNEWLEHIQDLLPEDNIYPDSMDSYKVVTKKLIPKVDPPVIEYFCNLCLKSFGSTQGVAKIASLVR